jgi:hypothetical protein
VAKGPAACELLLVFPFHGPGKWYLSDNGERHSNQVASFNLDTSSHSDSQLGDLFFSNSDLSGPTTSEPGYQRLRPATEQPSLSGIKINVFIPFNVDCEGHVAIGLRHRMVNAAACWRLRLVATRAEKRL